MTHSIEIPILTKNRLVEMCLLKITVFIDSVVQVIIRTTFVSQTGSFVCFCFFGGGVFHLQDKIFGFRLFFRSVTFRLFLVCKCKRFSDIHDQVVRILYYRYFVIICHDLQLSFYVS